MTPLVELIGNRIRVGPMLLAPDAALRLAHRILDALSPSYRDPEIAGGQLHAGPNEDRPE
jgi:hypothetical protein